jgi:hypothetical protein
MGNKVTVVLGGGLGNQLFQYFAGLYVARRTNSQLQVDSTFSQLGRTGHFDWIDVLQLPGCQTATYSRYSLNFILAFLRRSWRGLLARVFKTQERQLKYLHQYRSSEVGYDSMVDLLQPPITVMGYFQTWRFFHALKLAALAPEVKMKRVSDWYLQKSELLEGQGRVLGVHVRKGDYLANPRIGVLPASYYAEAVLALTERQLTWDAVWVFSDDVPGAKNELSSVLTGFSNVYFVEPPVDYHSFESLALMSKTSALVIANSTFSWWAATLGEPSRMVVCPDKWFSQMEDPTDLCPPDWIRASSSWA